ncbi:MAG: hypothetical protein IRY94_12105 [Rhodospirillaceae bacterium]|nr:hypothetical protein [Rhodospirillaceae bacterium]
MPEHARFDAWTVLPYGKGLVAIIARGRNGAPYGTASVYCDSEFKTQGPVFLYRVGGAVPSPAEVDRLNRLLQGASLSVDGETIQTVTRSDLGHSFSGLQLLEDGTLSYMVLIDPSVLESILHGQQMKAVLNFPPEVEADPRYAEQTIPLKNSRKAMEEALKHCV